MLERTSRKVSAGVVRGAPTQAAVTAQAEETAWFERTFERAAVGMALAALDGRWINVNQTLCRMVGYAREELLAAGFASITHPDDVSEDLASTVRLARGEIDSYVREKRYIRKDGATIWVQLTVSLVPDAAGAPQFFIAQILDITRRKRAESEVEAFFEASPDLLAVAGKDGYLDTVNGAWERTLGWTRDEITSTPFLEFVHPDDRERTVAEAQAVYAGRPSPSFRNRYRAKDDSYRWLEWSTRPGDHDRLYCVVRDVTEQVRAEELRRWLASMVESSQDAIIGLDVTHRVVSWNAAAERLFGYAASEMLGTVPEKLCPANRVEELAELRRRALEGARVIQIETERVRKDGRHIEVQTVLSRVEDATGALLGWAMSVRDVTERRQIENALAQQVEAYRAIARSLPRGSVCMFDRDLRFVIGEGPELFAALGISREGLEGRTLSEVSSPENRAALEKVYRAALGGASTEIEVVRGDRILMARFAPIRDASGTVTAGIVLTLDVTEQRRQAHELERAKLLMEATLSNIQDGVVLLDPDRRVLLANRAYLAMFGLDPERVVGMSKDDFLAHVAELAEDPQQFADAFVDPSQAPSGSSVEIAFQRPRRRILRRTILPTELGSQRLYLVVWHEVTAERDLIAEREREVFSDALTNIPNRRAAEGALAREHSRLERNGADLCVAMVDIDHFKQVNDRFGHEMGDVVLKRVAEALTKQARRVDTVARWGGEEFIAILSADLRGAQAFCERARLAVERLAIPGVGQVTISSGVVSVPRGEDISSALRRADDFLYRAKNAGRNRVVAG